MAGTPDLFVVCKSCGREVSPYITECPYCGQRLRKRAPKIERDGEGGTRPRPPRVPTPSLGRLRTGEIPGIKGEGWERPYVTIVLVTLSLAGLVLLAIVAKADIAVAGKINGQWWRAATSPFLYGNAWYELACLLPIAVYGRLIERGYSPWLTLALFVAGGMGGAAVAAAGETYPVAVGGNGAALALLLAWVVPVASRRRRGEEDDDDLLGGAILGIACAVMPLCTTEADPLAGAVGAGVGVLAGVALSRIRPRVV